MLMVIPILERRASLGPPTVTGGRPPLVGLRDRVHCFSMQVIINKCYLLNPEKNLAQIRLVVLEKKRKKRTFISEK